METRAIPGKVTVEPEVLETIVRFTALNVPGVVRLVEKDVDRLLGLTGKSVVVEVAMARFRQICTSSLDRTSACYVWGVRCSTR